MIADSAKDYGHLFPGMEPVAMSRLIAANLRCIEGRLATGEIIRAYG